MKIQIFLFNTLFLYFLLCSCLWSKIAPLPSIANNDIKAKLVSSTRQVVPKSHWAKDLVESTVELLAKQKSPELSIMCIVWGLHTSTPGIEAYLYTWYRSITRQYKLSSRATHFLFLSSQCSSLSTTAESSNCRDKSCHSNQANESHWAKLSCREVRQCNIVKIYISIFCASATSVVKIAF